MRKRREQEAKHELARAISCRYRGRSACCRHPLDPAGSIGGGARYLSQLMAQFYGNVEDALAAHNPGPGVVRQYGGVPPYAETQSYVAKVLANAEAYRQGSHRFRRCRRLWIRGRRATGRAAGALAYAGVLVTDSARTATAEGHQSTAGEFRQGGYEQAGRTPILGERSDASARSPEEIRCQGLPHATDLGSHTQRPMLGNYLYQLFVLMEYISSILEQILLSSELASCPRVRAPQIGCASAAGASSPCHAKEVFAINLAMAEFRKVALVAGGEKVEREP